MKILTKKIGEVIPYENNPRKNDNAVEKVAASIREFGFQNPIIVDNKNVIIAGHTRLKAAQQLGLKEVPVIVAEGLTEEQAKALRLADNKTAEFAEWDMNALDKEIAELTGIDMSQFGFEISEISPDEFGDGFNLPDVEKGEMENMTFTLHREQADLIRAAIDHVLSNDLIKDEYTFGNVNKNGNALYEVIREWDEQKI